LGAHLSATDTYAGRTLGSLGLTPGIYKYTWGIGAHADSVAVQIGPAAVPEPSTLTLGGLGALSGGGYWYRRRRRA
jgi:LPXTG-motif cell wall-anchored protein